MSLPKFVPGDTVTFQRTTREGVIVRKGKVVSLSWANRPKAEVQLGNYSRVWVEISKLKEVRDEN